MLKDIFGVGMAALLANTNKRIAWILTGDRPDYQTILLVAIFEYLRRFLYYHLPIDKKYNLRRIIYNNHNYFLFN